MRNKGYSKCNDITKAMRNLNKKSRILLSYSELKKICKCAPRDIMKIRKYCRTIKYTYRLDLHYFTHVHKADIVDLLNSTFSAIYLKYWHKVPVKYNITVLLRDNDDVYKRLI